MLNRLTTKPNRINSATAEALAQYLQMFACFRGWYHISCSKWYLKLHMQFATVGGSSLLHIHDAIYDYNIIPVRRNNQPGVLPFKVYLKNKFAPPRELCQKIKCLVSLAIYFWLGVFTCKFCLFQDRTDLLDFFYNSDFFILNLN